MSRFKPVLERGIFIKRAYGNVINYRYLLRVHTIPYESASLRSLLLGKLRFGNTPRLHASSKLMVFEGNAASIRKNL